MLFDCLIISDFQMTHHSASVLSLYVNLDIALIIMVNRLLTAGDWYLTHLDDKQLI